MAQLSDIDSRRVALLLAPGPAGERVQTHLQRDFACQVWPAGIPAGAEPRDLELLLVDSQALVHHTASITALRGQERWPKVAVLLLLAQGHQPPWPTHGDRPYDDVLYAPVCGEELCIRVHSLLALVQASRQNAQLLAEARGQIVALQQAKQAQNNLVSTLSHDLRSPLTAVKLAGERLTRQLVEPSWRRTAERIVASADRADAMICDLLDSNKREAEQPRKSKERVAMASLIDDVLLDLNLIHGDRFVQHPGQAVAADVDRDAMVRALENLCTNAVKYGYPSLPIDVQCRAQAGEVVLQVANHGDCVAEPDLTSLFLPYRQTKQAARRAEGWGLGLAYVREVATNHAGTPVAYRDDQGRNVFGLRFPVEAEPVA